jgi:SAM-dependent methyltransferase
MVQTGLNNLGSSVQPFIISCVLGKMRYNVIAFDVDPEPYMRIAKAYNVNVVRCDLERDELGISNADCAVFTEVLEHLHYYYVPLVLNKINRALKHGGVLILRTPNIASLFRRLRLLLGIQPIYRYHVREYTMKEVISLLREAGFEIVKAYYSIIADLTYIRYRSRGTPKDLKLQRLGENSFKEAYKTKHLKAPSIPISKAKVKPEAIDSDCRYKNS